MSADLGLPGTRNGRPGKGGHSVSLRLDEDSVPPAAPVRTDAFQVMPALTDDELVALRADIATRGIVVPVVVDQHGRLLDGHHRRQIAAELSITCPTEVVQVADDDAAHDLALTLNLARRHLTREQRRDLISAEIERRPDDSDRAIARRVGCSPSTVGAVRGVSKLDTSAMSATAARQVTGEIRAALDAARHGMVAAAVAAMSNHIGAGEVLRAYTYAQRALERDGRDPYGVVNDFVYTPIVRWLLDPATEQEWRPQWDHATFKPLSPDERAAVIESLGSWGGGWPS